MHTGQHIDGQKRSTICCCRIASDAFTVYVCMCVSIYFNFYSLWVCVCLYIFNSCIYPGIYRIGRNVDVRRYARVCVLKLFRPAYNAHFPLGIHVFIRGQRTLAVFRPTLLTQTWNISFCLQGPRFRSRLPPCSTPVFGPRP